MTRYVIRRLLWGILLLIVVCALTFVFFRIFPSGNPAVLRAGRDPQPHEILEIERVLGLDKSAASKRYARALIRLKDILTSTAGGLSQG